MLGAIVLVIAGVLVARAAVKNESVSAAPDKTDFAISQSAGAAPAVAAETEEASLPAAKQSSAPDVAGKPAVTKVLEEIAAFSELNSVAMGSAGVFIYMPAKGDSTATSPVDVMRGAAKTIEPQLGGKVGLFALKAGSPDYEQITAQMTVPGVIAVVPGGALVPVTGEITEAKLIQGFAGSVQSCGAGGCGPSGCG